MRSWLLVAACAWFAPLAMGGERSGLAAEAVKRALNDLGATRVRMDPNAKTGELVLGGKTRQFTIACVADHEANGLTLQAALIEFPDAQREAVNEARRQVRPPQDPLQTLVVIGSNSDASQVKHATVAPHALVTGPHRLEMGDFIGDNTLQLRVECDVMFAAREPKRVVTTRRIYMWRLPTLQPCAAITVKKFDPATCVIDKYALSFEAGERGERILCLKDLTGGETRRFPPEHEGYMRADDCPWALAKPVGKPDKRLRIVVVNERGEAMAGTRVAGHLRERDMSANSVREVSLERYTDDKGAVVVDVPLAVELTITARGYTDAEIDLVREEVPDQDLVIRLRPSDEGRDGDVE